MHKAFLSNVTFLVMVNLIIKPVYILIIDRAVQNVIGPAEYGLFFALFNFTYLFHIINDLGIQNYNAKTISQNPEKVTHQLSLFLGIKFWLGFIYIALIFTSALLLKYDSIIMPILGLLGINHICIGALYYLRSNLTALGRFREDAWLSILDRSLLIIIIGLMLIVPGWKAYISIYTFILAQTFAFTISILIGLILLKDVFPNTIKLNIDWKETKDLLGRTWPFAITIFLMTMYTRLDGVMIERLMENGKTEAGIYASGYRLLDASNMIIFLIVSLLLPLFASSWNDKLRLGSLLDSGFRLIVLICFPIAIVFFYYADEIISLLYDYSANYWGNVFSILILTYIPIGFIYLFSTYITASGDLKKMNQWFMISIGANFLLNLFLIPRQGAYGAAMATLITQSLVAFVLIIISRKSFALLKNIPWKNLAIFLLLCWLFPYFSYHYVNIPFILEIIIVLALLWLFAIILQIFRIDSIISLSKADDNPNNQ